MQYEDVRIKSSDVVTCVHELLFDFSIWEIFGALCNGASVCVVPRTMYLSPPDLIKLCDRLGVTVLSQTPAAFAALESDDRLMGNRAARAAAARTPGATGATGATVLMGGAAVEERETTLQQQNHPYLRSLRSIVFAGDKLDFSRLCRWFQRHDDKATKLFNCYGITETSVFSTLRRITAKDATAACGEDYPYLSLIGRPLAHNDFVVLNSAGKVVPRGVLGELYIGGLAVAKGYLRREQLTSERFLNLNYYKEKTVGDKMYFRTGDIVKYTDTGEFDFLGRVDQQLKVRGFRVEAFEVEQSIISHSSIKNAVAVVTKSPSLFVVFYTLKENEHVSKDELVSLARTKLPSYMVPQEFVCLEGKN